MAASAREKVFAPLPSTIETTASNVPMSKITKAKCSRLLVKKNYILIIEGYGMVGGKFKCQTLQSL
jgi:hypothetical protein